MIDAHKPGTKLIEDRYVELLHKITDEMFVCKEQLYTIIKTCKKKMQMLSDGKLFLQQVETKSTNLKTLGEELLSLFHSLA